MKQISNSVLRSLRAGFTVPEHSTLSQDLASAATVDAALSVLVAAISTETKTLAALGRKLARLQVQQRQAEMRMEALRATLLRGMVETGIRQAEAPDGSAVARLRTEPPSLKLIDATVIPDRFFRPVTPRLDKSRLRAALEAGEIVAGAGLSNGGMTLVLTGG